MPHFKVLGLDELEKEFKKDFKSASVEFGYGENSGMHPSGKISYEDIAYASEWGADINVFGNDGEIPPRPFFSLAVDEYTFRSGEIEYGMMRKGVFRSAWVVERLCEEFQYKLAEVIAEWKEPRNARLTVRKKGFNNPLVETGGLAKAAKKQGEIVVFEV